MSSFASQARYNFKRDQRIRHQVDFEAVKKNGTSRAHPLVVLRTLPNVLKYSRFAFIVSRRVGHNAVIRNRIRRQMRELARSETFANGWDLIFIARIGAANATFQSLQQAIQNVAKRARVLYFDDPKLQL